jgi:pseudaminic acid biosynthesis-associated methylase
MTLSTKQLQAWQGEFGNAYVDRNEATEKAIHSKVAVFSKILSHLPGAKINSILEVGANVGINIQALKRLTSAHIEAIEPNAKARKFIIDNGVLKSNEIHEGIAQNIPFQDESFDLVYTSGVLIHVAPNDLERAYQEIYRVSKNIYSLSNYFRNILKLFTIVAMMTYFLSVTLVKCG